MLKTEAIQKFLKLRTHDDLASMYNPNMEVQVNVKQGNGTVVEGEYKGKRWLGYTDNITTWKPIRIPHNANTEPTYTDSNIGYDLMTHCEGIGMTGWDWVKKVSKWVAFDFDALIGHSENHTKKLTSEELAQIQATVRDIAWVELRKSTSGRGLHLYVHVNNVPTTNHTEHACLARAILSKLSGLTGYDFAAKVDICGSNMWVWHSKMEGTDGLTLLKSGTVLEEIPANWREHLPIITRKRKRVEPGEVIERIDDFNGLVNQRTRTPLDSTHKKLLTFLEDKKCQWWWDTDNHMLVTHTIHLKEAHKALNFVGPFDTLSTGKDHGYDHNCFAFPLRNGAWAVRRYGQRTAEHSTWVVDGRGWTKCFYNQHPDLETVARLYEAIETEKNGFIFKNCEVGKQALVYLNIELQLAAFVKHRKIAIKELIGKSKLLVSLDREASDDETQMPGWNDEKKRWKRVYNYSQPHRVTELTEADNYDDRIRHIVSTAGIDAGWMLKVGETWREEALAHVKLAMQDQDLGNKDLNCVLGEAVNNGWRLVNKPFQPEYPGNREWNRNTARLRCPPNLDVDSLSFPTWRKIMDHCGQSLNAVLVEHPWCAKNGVLNGGDYLTLWLASLIQMTSRPLPYLFFWGEQNSGKSIFHEAFTSYIVANGHMRGNAALLSGANFNAEIENRILCIVEEVDLRKNNGEAYNKIKEWVTSPEILVHMKGMTPYLAPNYTHWVHTANDRAYCPVFVGDTRITMFHVPPPETIIPKDALNRMLEKEAPDFLAHLLNIEIPDSEDRLALPVIQTEDKDDAAENNMDALELFIHQTGIHKRGHAVAIPDFVAAFHNWLSPEEIGMWTKTMIGRKINHAKHPRGRLPGGGVVDYYGNLSLDPEAQHKDYYFTRVNAYLKPSRMEKLA